MKKVIIVCLSIIMVLSVVLTGCSSEKPYPSQAIDLVVPAAAGSGTDVTARILAKYLSKELGQPVNVVNKSGGNAVPGTQSVMTAKPDGYTLLADANMWSSFQFTVADLPFKVEDRTFVCKVSATPIVLFSDAKLPWNTLADVANAIKAEPEKFTWGGLGGQSSTDLAEMQFFEAIGVDISKLKKVVYQGGGQIMAGAAGGHVMFGGGGTSGIPPFIQSGKLKALAITGDKRMSSLGNVPTTKEAGYATVTSTAWLGISGPPKMPAEIVKKINDAVQKIIASPEYNEELNKVAAAARYVGPEEMKKEVLQEGEGAKKFFK